MFRNFLLASAVVFGLAGAANAQVVATPEQISQMKGICSGLGVSFAFDTSTGQPHCVLPQNSATLPDVSVDASNLTNSQYVEFHNTLKFPVTAITCQEWVMVSSTGTSWKHHNDSKGPIPPNGLYTINADKFQGYCKTAGSIVLHTPHGNFTASLDGGAGDWDHSTQLTPDATN